MDALKKAVAGLAKARPVLYCGCCPMTKCPNIRPAFNSEGYGLYAFASSTFPPTCMAAV
jgi:hypothetical protein